MKKKLFVIFLILSILVSLFFLYVAYNTYNVKTKYIIDENYFFSRVDYYDKTHLNYDGKIYTYIVNDTTFEVPSAQVIKYEKRPKEIARDGGFDVYYDINNPQNSIIPFFLNSKNTFGVIISICELVIIPTFFLTIVFSLIKFRKKLLN